jgi:hypothetical protein
MVATRGVKKLTLRKWGPPAVKNADWFDRLLVMAYEKAGSWEALTEGLGVKTRNTVSGWAGEYGREPKLGDFIALLKFMGGDISRAMPWWQPYPEASAAVRQENEELRTEVADLKNRLRIIQAVTIEPIGIPRHRNSRGYSAPDETLRFVLNEPSKDKPKKE